MSYVYEIDNSGKTIKEYEIDKYGNKELIYIDESIKDIKPFNLFNSVLSSYKLELKINEELYNKGNISKELYIKVADIILSKISTINNILNI